MTADISPQAATPARSRGSKAVLWLGVVLAGIPPLLGLSVALSALTAPMTDAGTQALTALWYIPAELFPVALLGVVLVHVGLRHDRDVRRATWGWSALVGVGLLGVAGLAFLTGMNRSQEALSGTARSAFEVGVSIAGLVYLTGLVGLVVLGLRRLRPSDRGLTRLAAILLGAALVTSALQLVQAVLMRRGTPAGTSPAPVVIAGVADSLVWAVLGVVVLVVVVRHQHRLRILLTVSAAVMVLAMVILKVLAASAWRFMNGPDATGPVSLPSALTMGMNVATVVALVAAAVLFGAAIALMARSRHPGTA